ncbi:MAG: hypothetical protein ACOYLS_14720 [Polymorphobacter sp.]
MSELPLWLIAVLLLAGFVLAAELGYLAHRRFGGRGESGETGDEGQVLSTALLLLALLLGFTFSMALGRYDERRGLVVAEANDIGTAWLRAGLVETPAGAALQARLAGYAETRLAMVAAGESEAAIDKVQGRGAIMRGEIWALATAASAPIRTTAQGAALIDSINSVIDIATTRETALDARVPERVIGMLVTYAVVSAFLLGYVMAAFGTHHRAATTLLFTLLAMTIVLILDLDRPRSGSIRVSQQPMIDLIADMKRSAPVPTTEEAR